MATKDLVLYAGQIGAEADYYGGEPYVNPLDDQPSPPHSPPAISREQNIEDDYDGEVPGEEEAGRREQGGAGDGGEGKMGKDGGTDKEDEGGGEGVQESTLEGAAGAGGLDPDHQEAGETEAGAEVGPVNMDDSENTEGVDAGGTPVPVTAAVSSIDTGDQAGPGEAGAQASSRGGGTGTWETPSLAEGSEVLLEGEVTADTGGETTGEAAARQRAGEGGLQGGGEEHEGRDGDGDGDGDGEVPMGGSRGSSHEDATEGVGSSEEHRGDEVPGGDEGATGGGVQHADDVGGTREEDVEQVSVVEEEDVVGEAEQSGGGGGGQGGEDEEGRGSKDVGGTQSGGVDEEDGGGRGGGEGNGVNESESHEALALGSVGGDARLAVGSSDESAEEGGLGVDDAGKGEEREG